MNPEAPANHQPARLAQVALRVPKLGLVHVSGTDGIKVISGLCTAQIKDLPVGQAREAFFPDDRGRVLAHAMVAHLPSGLWIVGQLAQPQALAAHIDRFIFREAAVPRDATNLWSAWLLDSVQALAAWLPEAPKDTVSELSQCCGELNYQGQVLHWLRWPVTGSSACLVWIAQSAAAILEAALQEADFTPIDDPAEFERRRISNFWPSVDHEITDRTLPQELDRDALAISFTKGCYLGQETVARLDALGQVQKKLRLIELTGDPIATPGMKLTSEGKEIGQITSVAQITSTVESTAIGRQVALAYLRRGHWSAGSSFQWNHGTGYILSPPLGSAAS